MNRRIIYTLAALALAGTAGVHAAESGDNGGGREAGGPGSGMHGPGPGPGMGERGPGPGEGWEAHGGWGRGGHGAHGGGPGQLGRALLGPLGHELGLSADQRIQVFSILEKARPQFEAIDEQLRANHEQLAAVDPGDPKYAATVSSAARPAGEAASRRVTEGSQLRTALWNVLTPEQRTKAKAIIAKFKERREHGDQHRRGEGAPPPPPAG